MLHSVGRREENGDVRKVCDCPVTSLQTVSILGYFNAVHMPAERDVLVSVKTEHRTHTVRNELL